MIDARVLSRRYLYALRMSCRQAVHVTKLRMRVATAGARLQFRNGYRIRMNCICTDTVREESSDRVHRALLKHARRGNLRPLVQALDLCRSPNSVCDDNGRTALHLAAIGGHKECLKALLRRRVDPNMSVCTVHSYLYGGLLLVGLIYKCIT